MPKLYLDRFAEFKSGLGLEFGAEMSIFGHFTENGKTSILVNRRVPTGERGHIIHQNDGFSSAVDLTL